MFEAYKVGVTLALTNQVSGVLGLISRDFMKTRAEASALQLELKKIKLLGMSGALLGGAGFLGLKAIGGAVKPAMEYAAQLNRMNMAGMKQVDIAQAVQDAWKNTATVMTTTATGNLKSILDLRNVLGTDKGLDEVERLLPVVSKIQAVMASASDVRLSKNADDIAFGMAKALDIIGAVRNQAQMEKEAGLMSRSISAFQGRVTPQQFQSVFQYARQSKFDLSDEFKYEILPSIMLEYANKGGGGGSRGVGPSLAAMYRYTNQGYINKLSLPELAKLGLVNPGTALKTTTSGTTVGAMTNAALAASNPFQWVNQVLVPAIRSKYGQGSSDEFIRQEINSLMRGNQLAASMAVEFFTKQQNFLRDQGIIRGAMPYDQAYAAAMKNDPHTGWDAVGAQWENLKTAIGITVVPILLPAMRGLTVAFNGLGGFLQRHSTLTSALTITFTALSGLAFIGGSLMIAGAGLKLVGIGLGVMGSPLTALAAVPLAGIASGIGLIAIALAALASIVYHKEIADAIDKDHPGIGDALMKARNFLRGDDRHVGFSPPSGGGKTIQVNTQLNVDGRTIARAVTDHQYYDMNRDLASGSGFDGRLSFASPGVP